MRGRWRSVLGAAAALVAALVGGGCQVDVSVTVEAGAGGSGTVEVTALLDRRAAEALGDVDERVRADDLRAAGWSVAKPEARDDGSVALVARRGFATPGEARQVLADVGFDDFEVTQRRGFFVTETELTGNVDLRRGIEAFADAELATAFGGPDPLGVPAAELERRMGAPTDRAVGLQIAVRLPGRVEANAPTVGDGGAVWSPALGEQARLEASARRVNVLNLALVAVSAGSGAAAVVIAGGRAARRRRRSR